MNDDIKILVRKIPGVREDGRALWHACIQAIGSLDGTQAFGLSKPEAVHSLFKEALKVAPDKRAELSIVCAKTLGLFTWVNEDVDLDKIFANLKPKPILVKEENLFSYFDGKAWREVERPSEGFYKHHKGDIYYVWGIGILDEHGHGDPDAPRQVIYHSTRSVKTKLPNLRKEEEWVAPVEWPDGVVRPRFIRVEYGEVK